jgi:O-antigen ligase
VVLSLAALPVAVLWFAPPSWRDPVIRRVATFEALDRDKPFQARQLLNRKGILLFQQNPVFGAGLGEFAQTIVPLEIPPPLSHLSREEFDRRPPHNSYVKVLAEMGLFGASVLFCWLAFLTCRGLPAVVVHARLGETWAIPVFAGFLAMNLHLWTLSGLTGTAPWFLYGMLAGIIERQSGARSSRAHPAMEAAAAARREAMSNPVSRSTLRS